MKTAVCISGQPRFFDVGYHFINQNIIKPNDCDVFLHAWYDKSKNNKEYSCASWNEGMSDCSHNDTDKFLLEMYQPKLHLFEPEHESFPTPRDIEEYKTKNTTDSTANIIFSMFNSICKSIQLKEQYEKENDFTYDCVVRLRYDCAVIDPMNLEDISKHNDFKNSIYYCDVIRNPNVMCDYFNFGNSENMNKYAEIFDNLDSYWNEDKAVMCGEEMLTYHITKHHKMNAVGLPISTLLIRDRELKNQNFGRVYSQWAVK
jgi:hypothetical protein